MFAHCMEMESRNAFKFVFLEIGKGYSKTGICETGVVNIGFNFGVFGIDTQAKFNFGVLESFFSKMLPLGE